MNNLFNNNFMLGFILAKDREQNDRINAGLQLSQAPANNMVSVVLMKKQLDKIEELETDKKNLESSVEVLRRQLSDNPPDNNGDGTNGDNGNNGGGAPNDCIDAETVSVAIAQAFSEYQVPDAVTDTEQATAVQESIMNLGNRVLAAIQENRNCNPSGTGNPSASNRLSSGIA